MGVSDLERVLTRLADDPLFADAVRERPLQALRDYRLDDDARRRLEAVLDGTVTLDRLLSREPDVSP